MNILGIIPARAGSVGVPGKNVRLLLGRPVISYTVEAARAARQINYLAVSSDDPQVEDICRRQNLEFIARPKELAGNTSQIDDAMRHCVCEIEREKRITIDIAVLLYANVAVRAEGIIDRAIERLIETDADSVQTVIEPGKFHPYWLYQLDGDKAAKYIENNIYRRQELPKLYAIDGAVGAVKRQPLMNAAGSENPHAFWGNDRRVIIQEPHETVDIDSIKDFYLAEAALRHIEEDVGCEA